MKWEDSTRFTGHNFKGRILGDEGRIERVVQGALDIDGTAVIERTTEMLQLLLNE